MSVSSRGQSQRWSSQQRNVIRIVEKFLAHDSAAEQEKLAEYVNSKWDDLGEAGCCPSCTRRTRRARSWVTGFER